jgi:DNA-binding GntR family transcriptional regulator
MPKGISIHRTASLRDQVSNAVLELLRANELGPGDRITEEALANRFEVSRTPIREALARLAQRGVLERRRSGGYYVPSLSETEIQDIIAVRMLLEPAAARLAAEHARPDRVRDIDRAIRAQADAIVKGNPDRFSSANEDFHEAIFGAVPNQVLRKAIAQFDPHIYLMRTLGKIDTDRFKKMIERQSEIKDAIEKRNADMAETLWKNYLQHTREWLVETIAYHANEDANPAEFA